jgi:hypothetical protein
MARSLLLNGVSYLPLLAADGVGEAAPAADGGSAALPAAGDDVGAAPSAAADAGAGDGVGDDEAAAGDPPPAPVHKPDWRDRELRKRGDQLARERAAKADLAAENERLRALWEAQQRRAGANGAADAAAGDPATGATPPEPRPATPAANSDDAVEARAKQMATEWQNQEILKAAETKGQEAYKEKWLPAVENLRTLGGFDPDTMQGILATDDPARLLFDLGSDPNKYHRLMDMPPHKRLVELGKLATAAAAPAAEPPKKKISDAPAPVDPVNRSARAPEVEAGDYAKLDALPDEKYFAWRTEQKRKSVGRPWSLPNGGGR